MSKEKVLLPTYWACDFFNIDNEAASALLPEGFKNVRTTPAGTTNK